MSRVPSEVLARILVTGRGGDVAELMAATERYALSFTSGALLTREAVIAAPLYLESGDWAQVRQDIEEGNLFQARTRASGFRLAREVAQRLSVLTRDELDYLLTAPPTERGYVMWAAACRRYRLIGEFAEEVVRERYLLLASSVGYDDFDAFLRGKALWHEEIADLKASTVRKLRSTLFQMLVEANLLSADGLILHVMLPARLTQLLADDVRFFPSGGGA